MQVLSFKPTIRNFQRKTLSTQSFKLLISLSLCILCLSGIIIVFMKKLFTNLTFWVLLAITAGILIGHFYPEFALQKILNSPLKGKFLGQELTVGATVSEFLSGILSALSNYLSTPSFFLRLRSALSAWAI